MEAKYNHLLVEEGKYQKWLNEGYFTSGDLTKKPYAIVIPPPNITGNLHLGHAWNTTLQDIIIRYKKMNGFDTLWLPGMDHAAIATESKVVSKLKAEGKSKQDLTREEFLEECWQWKELHANNIRKQWATLGLSLDYSKERFTLNPGLNNAVNYVFVDLYNKGLIYRGEKIINWDPIAQTALSNEEVIYKEEKSHLYYLKYFYENSNDYILVATTRPETIYGDTAVAVNPKDEKYKSVVGKNVIVPLVNRVVPVIADDEVLTDFGTGALKITPAHSLEDFEIGKRHNLEIINSINPNGTLNEVTGKYNNMAVTEARIAILKDLEALNLIAKIEDYTHSIGYSERTDALVEPYLSKQWFVKMDLLAKNLLDIQKTENGIKFIPKRFEKILNHWMNNCKDWCISRQLYWGHRIPVWYKNDEIFVGMKAPEGAGWIQDNDVLDTWFSSALWPFSTLGWPDKTPELERYFPNNLLVTGYDIIFFWVARMAFSSVEQFGKVPFKDCLIHGLIRDKQGRKMSKSLGNGIDPMDMINKYGADSLRFYLSTSTAPGMDLRFDEEKLKSTWNFINKLWNASRFVLTNVNINNITLTDLTNEDKWILNKLNLVIKNTTKYMDKYEFNNVGSLIYNFFWNDFCDSYIEMAKYRLNGINTQSTLKYVLKNILQLLHPFIPFVTDEIYTMLLNENILVSDYPKYNKELIFTKETSLVEDMILFIKKFRNTVKENNITKNMLIKINNNEDYNTIKSVLRLNDKITSDDLNMKNLNVVTNNYNITIYFNEEIDEAKRNEEIENLKQSIIKRKTLLANNNFIRKAPDQLVNEEKVKLNNEEQLLNELLK